MIGHVSSRLRLLSVSLAQHWLQTLIVSVLAVFAASYFYLTNVHALESFDAGSCTPLAAGDPGKCMSDLQALLDGNRPYPGITVDGYFGAQTPRALIDFQSAHNLAGDGVVAAQTAHAINKFSRGRVFSAIRPGSRIRSWPGRRSCASRPS